MDILRWLCSLLRRSRVEKWRDLDLGGTPDPPFFSSCCEGCLLDLGFLGIFCLSGAQLKNLGLFLIFIRLCRLFRLNFGL